MSRQIYEEALDALRKNRGMAIRTVFSGSEGVVGEDLKKTPVDAEYGRDRHGLPAAEVTCEKNGAQTIVTEPVLPPERLIILGGGHVALALCEIAAKCGFRVTVCDDRPEFAARERFPAAQQVLCGPFEGMIEKLEIGGFDYAVIVTRGHAGDGDCLRKLLKGPAPAYIGMIGSKRKIRALYDLLEKEGFPKEAEERVCAPIGLPIGSVTPEEIAVSITAELIAHRRLPEYANGRPRNTSDLDPEMIRVLSESAGPQAVATIIRSEGSSPRGAGAKMIVAPDGKTIGTIGGGRPEKEVIREAAAVAGTGRFKVCTFDMGGEAEDRQALICGGITEVLIEDM